MTELTHEQVLKEIRLYIAANHNLKMGDFANKVGYSGATISAVLRGVTPPPEKVLQVVGIRVCYVKDE